VGLPADAGGIRVSDRERDEAALRLHGALLDGRLALPEFEQRLALALRARVADDLDALFVDLPAPEPALPPLASWGRRSLALLLDHLLLALVVIAVLGVGALTGQLDAAALAATLATPWLAVGYFTAAHGGRSGRSIGERSCGIAVRSDPHRSHVARRATYGQAFGRALLLYLFAGLSFCGVGALNFLWPLFDLKKQAWHDKVAGTIVVRADALEFDRRRWAHRWRDEIEPTLRRWLRRAVRGPGSGRPRAPRERGRPPFPPR
jgi:uncharacterized RDD family membrane protein YckC